MITDFIRNKPRTTALIAVVLATIVGYAVFVAKDPASLLNWTPLALCLLMHVFMHGGHGHAHEKDAE